jgi:oxaloacetate decarboxylase gamma subunit
MQIGLLLMVVGMLTVFAILLIVIYGSRLLVAIVNKIAPEEARPVRSAEGEDVSAEERSVLAAAVAQLTAGKGQIAKITRIR